MGVKKGFPWQRVVLAGIAAGIVGAVFDALAAAVSPTLFPQNYATGFPPAVDLAYFGFSLAYDSFFWLVFAAAFAVFWDDIPKYFGSRAPAFALVVWIIGPMQSVLYSLSMFNVRMGVTGFFVPWDLLFYLVFSAIQFLAAVYVLERVIGKGRIA